MFSFFRKKEKNSFLSIDLHSHLIPAIDDGSRNMEETLSLLRKFVDLGYKKVITTPHIMSDGYRNTPEIILEGLEKVRAMVKKEGLEIEIEAAAEYYLDDGFLQHLQSGNLLTVGEYLLFETSYVHKPLLFDEMIFEIAAAGYKPMLAHPERYRYITDPETEYAAMKEKGIYFQVNLNSFTGYYGKDAKKKAEFLNESGMIDFLGSDTHRIKHLESLKEIQKMNIYKKLFHNNVILNETL